MTATELFLPTHPTHRARGAGLRGPRLARLGWDAEPSVTVTP